ncbi:TetR family transcriptional regulator [Actinoplanes sp. NPDC049596]|uniref:TetR/AcrR family transcriptional regulator n=1 Tax=unclassified Actinoplanes TaxID=2626549 RepID=UPI0034148F06
MTAGQETAPRRRDAAKTRLQLLEVARCRFARQGYATTTVRDIADDAGVNVALISRYFESKEGLFKACLDTAFTEIRKDADQVTPGNIAAVMARKLIGAEDSPRRQEGLLLLLRTSGDERVDEMRRDVLRAVSERLARATGDPTALLRAEIVLSAMLGITMMRSSLRVQPLATATEEELLAPLSDLISGLLGPAR